MKALQFCNFSDEPFVGKFDGMEHPAIAPGESIYLEDFKAELFAKHLIDREINRMSDERMKAGKEALRTDDKVLRAELLSKCFPSAPVEPIEAIQIEEKKKRAPKAKKVEEEFEELEN